MKPPYKVLISFGTRPEAIKLAPVINELRKYPKQFVPVVVATAQHRQMLDQVLDVFDIRPDHDLNIMTDGQSLSDVVVKTLKRLEPVLRRENPHFVLVQGDASSAFASALASYYHKIPIGHVEAGLRTYDKYSPFPEEVNRRFITLLADIHFAPTPHARENLIAEGVESRRIHVTGNTVIDALKQILRARQARVTSGWGSKGNRLLLVTLHRRESFGLPLRGICRALITVVHRNPDVTMVVPVHPNPQIRRTIREMLGGYDRIQLIEPLAYPDFVSLMRQAYLILTDSGGIQEEAPMLGKPVIILREKTERREAVEYGTAVLAGTAPEMIVQVTERILGNLDQYRQMVRRCAVFGDGRAAQRIRRIINSYLLSVDTEFRSPKL